MSQIFHISPKWMEMKSDRFISGGGSFSVNLFLLDEKRMKTDDVCLLYLNGLWGNSADKHAAWTSCRWWKIQCGNSYEVLEKFWHFSPKQIHSVEQHCLFISHSYCQRQTERNANGISLAGKIQLKCWSENNLLRLIKITLSHLKKCNFFAFRYLLLAYRRCFKPRPHCCR